MPNIQTRSTLGDLGKVGLGPVFEDIFDQNLVRYQGMDIASKIFSFLNTDKAVIRTTGLTGYNLPTEFQEGEPFPEVSNIKTYETLYTIKDYGSAVTVTYDCLDDREKLGKKLDEMANLSASIGPQEAKASFQILNGGFSTAATYNGTSIARYNSEALFAASHTRADGGTAQSNYSASSIALTELNLETGRLALMKQLADNGLPILDMGVINLVVPDDLIKNAVIFTNSQLRATTANNDLNFYQGRINAISSRWLNSNVGGSSTAWYLIAKVANMPSPLRVYRKGGPRFNEAQPEARTWNKVFAVMNRYAVGYSDWRGTWGSAGA